MSSLKCLPNVLIAALAAFALGFSVAGEKTHTKINTITKTVQAAQDVETVYVVNQAPKYFSNEKILKDIPAWEKAANRDFAPVWHTPQVQIKLDANPPAGSIQALFVKSGSVQGALAYHTVTLGVPQIVVYAGTDDYYGFSNSISFTHELFEMLADPGISITNQGYPYPYYYVGKEAFPQLQGTVWANEVCDAVEAYAYRVKGVSISDFVTPNWFNDHVSGGYDHMGVVQSPFVITKGGYSQFWDGQSWTVIQNFRHAGADADGFYKAEQGEDR